MIGWKGASAGTLPGVTRRTVPACDGLRVLELCHGTAGTLPGVTLADNGAGEDP